MSSGSINGQGTYRSMEVGLASSVCRGGYCKSRLHLSFSESTVLQTLRGYACGIIRSTFSRHHASEYTEGGRGERKALNGWEDRFLFVEENLPVRGRKNGGRNPNGNESSASWGFSILSLKDNVKRRRELDNISVRCPLPDVNRNGHGFL